MRPTHARNWQLGAFCFGRAGDKHQVEIRTTQLFRGENLVMAESVPDSVIVRAIHRKSDNLSQFPPGIALPDGSVGTMSRSFPPHLTSSCVSFDTLSVGDAYVFSLEFIRDCRWEALMTGRVTL